MASTMETHPAHGLDEFIINCENVALVSKQELHDDVPWTSAMIIF